jgi:hypothetical protein
MRKFESGATRDQDTTKPDYAGFLSPEVLAAYAAYMHKNRIQADGTLRASDNWKKGIPQDAYISSMFRHFMSVWQGHINGHVEIDELAALMFNVMGYMFEELRDSQVALKSFVAEEYLTTPAVRKAFADELIESVIEADVMLRAWDNAYGVDSNHYTPVSQATDKDDEGIFTHRYGALAHDSAAIEDEEEPRYKSPLPKCPYSYTQDENAAIPSVSEVEHSEVLGIPPQRVAVEVDKVAPEVRTNSLKEKKLYWYR